MKKVDRNPRKRSALWLLAAPLAAAAMFLTGPGATYAAVHNPIPANAFGDPTDEFADNESIWAYMTADIAGGRICIVPESGGSCDSPAMGHARVIAASIGTVFTLLQAGSLSPGRYRLLSEDSLENPLDLSPPFTVYTCPNCPKTPDDGIVSAFKAGAGAMKGRMDAMCEIHGVLEMVAGKAIGMRGLEKTIDGKITGSVTVSTPSFALTFSGSVTLFSFTVQDPATANIRKGLDILHDLACGAELMYRGIEADPPDPDFSDVAQPEPYDIGPIPPGSLDGLVRSVDLQRALAEATLRGFERYQGALAAGDTGAQIRQLRAAGEFAQRLANELGESAEWLRAWANDAAGDPELAGTILSSSDHPALAALYQRVDETGFNAQEIAEFHALGYTDEAIAAIRTHASVGLDDLPLDTAYPTALRNIAADLERQIDPIADFASEVSAIAGRIEAASTGGSQTPVANDDTLGASPGDTASLNVLANDSDPDGDMLTVTGFTQGAHGTVACTTAGTCTYTPAAGFTGSDSFTYTASDGNGGTDVGTVNVTVNATPPPVNAAPVATDDQLGTAAGVQGSVNVLANDSDADGDALTVSAFTQGANGTVSCTTAGNCAYTPAAGFSGSDSFTYTASDGRGASDVGTVAVTVTSTGVPVANDDDVEILEDQSVSVSVLANDSDPNDDPLTITSVGDAPHGSTFISGGTRILYSPDLDYNGSDSFTYTISDGNGGTSTATVTVTVAPVNDAPRAVSDSVTTQRDHAVTVDVLANDTDADDDSLSSGGVVDAAARGSAICTTAGVCTYTPDAGYVGVDQFSYRVEDGQGGAATGIVSVRIGAVGTAPAATFTIVPSRGLVPLKVRFDASNSGDADGTIVEYRWDFGDGSTGTGVTALHDYTSAGTFAVQLTVVDNDGNVVVLPERDVSTKGHEDLELPICGDEDSGPVQFHCSAYTWSPDAQLFEVEGTGDVDVVVDFVYQGGGESELVAFHVDDRSAAIGSLRPDDPGYLAAALGRAQVVFPKGSNPGTPDATIRARGGTYLVFMLVAFDTLEHFKQNNPINSQSSFPTAFFSIDDLNNDSLDHFASYTHTGEDSLQIGFEDLSGGGDLDFNDIVFNVQGSLVPVASLAVEKRADRAVSSPGAQNGYMIVVSNAGMLPATITRVTDTLPTGFSYRPGSTTGVSTTDPSIAGNTLTWTGPFDLPTGGSLTLHFGVTVASIVGSYDNRASAEAGPFTVSGTGPTATVRVEATDSDDPPVATDDTSSVDQDASDTPVDVLANDTDEDGGPKTIASVTHPANGSVTVAADDLSVSYRPNAGYCNTGGSPDTFTYTLAPGGSTATVSVTVNCLKPAVSPTSLTVAPATGDFADATTVSAVLALSSTSAPIAGKSVTLTLNGDESCTATTDATGKAACAVTPGEPAGTYPLTASFAGDATHGASTGSSTFVVSLEETALSYTGEVSAVNGRPMTLSGVLTTDDPAPDTPIAGRTVTFTLGSGFSAQSCSGTTDASGSASCSLVSLAQVSGPVGVSGQFAGDTFYEQATASANANVFPPPATGAFVIGDRSAGSPTVGTSVYFWGSQWAKRNSLSGGKAPSEMKGFADSPTSVTCGAHWETRPGNSSAPPSTLPTRINVIVSKDVKKRGSTMSGTIEHIVVVEVAPGYGPDPGHAGAGKIVEIVC